MHRLIKKSCILGHPNVQYDVHLYLYLIENKNNLEQILFLHE